MKKIELKYEKGGVYTPCDDGFPPKHINEYFESSEDLDFHPDYEKWTAMRCIKSVTVTVLFST